MTPTLPDARGRFGSFGGRFVPLYMMISFTRIPYAEALRAARRQNRVFGGVAITALLLLVFLLLRIL